MKKIAIHGCNGFAKRWPESARILGCEPIIVNAYGHDFWQKIDGCEAFLWNINHDDQIDLNFSRSILLSVRERGLRVFPNHATCWHFDDKIAQAYLLTAINAPLAETWIFFNENEAFNFLSGAIYPIVFKIRRGAGSLNVKLVLMFLR